MVCLLQELYERFPDLESKQLSQETLAILSSEKVLARKLKSRTGTYSAVNLNAERLREESIQLRLVDAIKQIEAENRKLIHSLSALKQ